MHATIDICGPVYGPADRRRGVERQKAAASIVRQLMLQMVQAGWRESEAALTLADAFDDYCLYLAEHPPRMLEAANGNAFSVAS
jgi:hypothetical protein